MQRESAGYPCGGDKISRKSRALHSLQGTAFAFHGVYTKKPVYSWLRYCKTGLLDAIIISFIIYFFLGYLLYASLFAAIGSAVENEADTQQLQMPVTIPLLIGFFIAFYAFKAPESQVVFWGSMIPLTSPIVMLARIPFGVPVWELALSIALLVVTFAFFAYISGKIYKIGILMYGKKTTFKDLYKWLKMK